MFWYPKFPTKQNLWRSGEQDYPVKCQDFFPEVLKLPIMKMMIDLKDYGGDNKISEVHKSDFLRLHLLSTMGGLWSDMDIFYLKPMETLYFNVEDNKNIETFYCDHNYGHSIGFLMASQNNKFFKKLIEISKEEYNPTFYQAMGAMIFKNHFSTSESINAITPAFNMDMDVVYPHDATYFKEILTQLQTRFTDKTIGIHWYGGHEVWKHFFYYTNGGLVNLPNNIIGNLLKNEREFTN